MVDLIKPETITFAREDLREVCAQLHGTEVAMREAVAQADVQMAYLNTTASIVALAFVLTWLLIVGYAIKRMEDSL